MIDLVDSTDRTKGITPMMSNLYVHICLITFKIVFDQLLLNRVFTVCNSIAYTSTH